MTSNLEEPFFQNLGQLGIAWTRDRLSLAEGYLKSDTLSHHLLSKLKLNDGETFLIVAIAEHQEAVKDHRPLKYGMLPLNSHKTIQPEMLLTELKKLERERVPISIVVEDSTSNPNGPVEKYSESEVYHLDKQYLYVRKLSDMQSATELSNHLGLDWFLNAYVVADKDIPAKKVLSKVDADKLAVSVVGIINDAYDDETYTFWVR